MDDVTTKLIDLAETLERADFLVLELANAGYDFGEADLTRLNEPDNPYGIALDALTMARTIDRNLRGLLRVAIGEPA